MRWRVLLILSACVNAVLIAALWHYTRQSGTPSPALESTGTNDVKYRTHVVVRRQFFTWDQVESSDYATYIANLRDIIASKKASGRKKDMNELPLLEAFREEYEKRHTPPLRSAADIAAQRKGV